MCDVHSGISCNASFLYPCSELEKLIYLNVRMEIFSLEINNRVTISDSKLFQQPKNVNYANIVLNMRFRIAQLGIH